MERYPISEREAWGLGAKWALQITVLVSAALLSVTGVYALITTIGVAAHLDSHSRGTVTSTLVPAPGFESTRRLPPSISALSLMDRRPTPQEKAAMLTAA